MSYYAKLEKMISEDVCNYCVAFFIRLWAIKGRITSVEATELLELVKETEVVITAKESIQAIIANYAKYTYATKRLLHYANKKFYTNADYIEADYSDFTAQIDAL